MKTRPGLLAATLEAAVLPWGVYLGVAVRRGCLQFAPGSESAIGHCRECDKHGSVP